MSVHHEVAHAQHGTAFGSDAFGRMAERIARFFGTPRYLIAQTFIVAVWILVNLWAVTGHFDERPFILLNLIFSTQAAYAAPLILLAQTRQAARDKAFSEADLQHRQIIEANHTQLLLQNTELTQQILTLTQEVHTLTQRVSEHLERP